MTTSTLTLSELREWAEEEELSEALDSSIEVFRRELGLRPRDVAAVGVVADSISARQVRDFLGDTADRRLATYASSAGRDRVRLAIEAWLNDMWDAREAAAELELAASDEADPADAEPRIDTPAADSAAALAPAPPPAASPAPQPAAPARREEAPPIALSVEPPTKLADLRAWAEASGVAHRLTQPVAVLSRYSQGSAALAALAKRQWTVNDIFFREELSRFPQADVATLTRLARVHLRDGVENARAAEARRRGVEERAVEPSDPRVRAFLGLLRQAHAEVALVDERRTTDLFAEDVVFEAPPGQLVYVERDTKHGVARRVLRLPVEQPALDMALRHRAYGAPELWRSAVSAFIDVVLDPQAPAHDALVDKITRPPWEKLVARLDAAFAPLASRTAGPKPRLAFRIREEFEGVTIEPIVQQPRADGSFTKGSASSSYDLQSAIASGQVLGVAGDEIVVTLIENLSSHYGASRQMQAATVLARLRHRPNVVVGRAGVPAVIRDGRVVLTLEPDESGDAHLVFVVGGRKMRARELQSKLHRASVVVHVDEPTGHVDVVRVDDATRALVEAVAELDMALPLEAQRQVVARLHKVAPDLDLDLPDALVGRLVEAGSTPVVRLAPFEGDGLELAIVVRPLPGVVFEPGEGPGRVLGAIDGEAVTAVRERDAERERADSLVAALGLGPEDTVERHTYRVAEVDRALDVVDALDAWSGEITVEWPEGADRMRVEGDASLNKLRVRVRSARDWFGLEGDLEVGDATIALAALLAAVRRGARYVALGKRRFARIADDLRAKLAPVADVVRDGKSGAELTIGALPAVDALLEDVPGADLAKSFVELRQRMRRASREDPELPKDLRAELRGYQADGVKWLLRLRAWGAGACLADDMGLGKTLQALAVLLHGAAEGPSLVVAPTSVVSNWSAEAARFAPTLSVKILRGADRHALLASAKPHDLFVTSYDVMLRDVDALKDLRFANVVFDEAQALKNPATRRAKAAREIDAVFRIALSGTPIENHLGELWSLYRVIVPGLLGSVEQFRERFAIPIERAQDRARQAALSRVVRPFLLRRTKAEVAPELPSRTEMVREIDLSPAERTLYDAARLAALAALSGPQDGTDKRFAILAAMTRLRRLACHPRLVDETSTVSSSKLAAFLELAREVRDAGQKALVFSQFTTHLALVRDALGREGITCLELDGSTPAEQRKARVDAFQAGRADVFLISLKAGGTGLNLTAAEVVVHLDPWWNPAAEDQATDRAHRIGQTKPVTVVRLVARGTIEQAVLALHAEKRALAQGLLDGADAAGSLSGAELVALVRAGEGEPVGAAEGDGGIEGDDGGAEEEVVASVAEKPRAKARGRKAREREST